MNGNNIANRIKSEVVHHRIIQKQLQMNIIKKYLKKDVYLQKMAENYWRPKIDIIV